MDIYYYLSTSISVEWLAGISILIISFIFIINYPEVGLAFLSVNYFLLKGIRFPYATLSHYFVLIVVLSLINYVIRNRSKIQLSALLIDKLLLVVSLFFLWKVISYFTMSISDPYSLGISLIYKEVYSEYLPFLGIILLGNNVERLHRYVYFVCYSIGVSIFIYFFSFLFTSNFFSLSSELWRYKVSVFGYQLLSFGDYGAIGVIIGTVWLLQNTLNNRFTKVVIYFFISASFIIMLLGGARALIVSFTIAITYTFVNLKKIRKIFFSKWILTISSFLFVLFLFASNYLEIFSVIEKRFNLTFMGEAGLSARPENFQAAFQRFLESPIIGVGIGAGGQIVSNAPFWESDLSSSQYIYRMEVHNFYLGVLAEQGLVGFTLLIIFFVLLIKLIKKTKTLKNSFRSVELALMAKSIIILGLLIGLTGDIKFLFISAAILWSINNWKNLTLLKGK